jgi:hypothetical protein
MIHLALSILAAMFLAAIGFMLVSGVFWGALCAWCALDIGWKNLCEGMSNAFRRRN